MPGTAHGRPTERSAGKDTTTGHREMAGIVLDHPFPLYPNGKPEIVEPFERAIGRPVLGNIAASGMEIIELGEEHLRTGRLDPLHQWRLRPPGRAGRRAARDAVRVVPDREEFLVGEHNVGRVIARRSTASRARPGAARTRRDFSVPPPGPTLLDVCRDAGVATYGVGKIRDIFAERGLTEASYSDSNDHGIDLTIGYPRWPAPTLVFSNLVDFDSQYGHRNDPEGYARAIEALDARIPEVLQALEGGVLLLTGDHGATRPHPRRTTRGSAYRCSSPV